MKALVSRIVIQNFEKATTIQFVGHDGQVIRDAFQDPAIVITHQSNTYRQSLVETIMIGTFSRLGAEISLERQTEEKVIYDLRWFVDESADELQETKLAIKIEHLDYLRVRAMQVLKQNGITKVSDLKGKTEDDLLALHGFGHASLYNLCLQGTHFFRHFF